MLKIVDIQLLKIYLANAEGYINKIDYEFKKLTGTTKDIFGESFLLIKDALILAGKVDSFGDAQKFFYLIETIICKLKEEGHDLKLGLKILWNETKSKPKKEQTEIKNQEKELLRLLVFAIKELKLAYHSANIMVKEFLK